MKRLHVHISVEDLKQSINFYSTLFGTEPTKLKADYAKWMLEDPRVNFAISARGAKPGLDHMGIQTEDEDELSGLRDRLKNADLQAFSEGETVCCYAKSDKSWVQDPNGIAWEAYHTMGDAEFFNEAAPKEAACCAPAAPEPKAAASCGTTQTGCC